MSVFLELLAKSAADLRGEYQSLGREEMSMRFQHAAKQLKDTSALRLLRRKKARVKTALAHVVKRKG